MSARVSRRNSAFKYYVNGKAAKDLHGLTGIAGDVLSSFDTAVARAAVGLKRRTVPAVSRAVRENYNIKAGSLRDKYRAETGRRGGSGSSEFVSIYASTRQVPLLEFRGRWSGRKSKGATANISGTPKTYESAFIATVQGRRAIRARSFESTGRRAGRGPLRMLYGPSPFEMVAGFNNKASLSAKQEVLSQLRIFYTTELRRQWRLSRGD